MDLWQRQSARRGTPWPDEAPLVLLRPGRHGPVVHAANAAAAREGVTPEARASDIRALCPEIHALDADPAGDAARLRQLAFWARRWGPWSATDGADGLLIDSSGVAHLFGGEPGLLAAIETGCARAGLTARVSLAPTSGAAWGLARFGPPRAVAEDVRAALAPLPVAALRLAPETLLLLRRLGLKTIGDLAALPRLALMRRFARAALAENPLLRLDQALGLLAEPLAAPEPPPAFVAEARLAEPVQDPTPWLPGLVATLCAQLAAEAQGCRRLRLSIFRVDGERREIALATARPTREAAHLLALFQGRLERLDPGFGFDLLRLTGEAVEPLEAAQPGLDGPAQGLALARLVDRLVARFGADSVHSPLPQDSHIPERSEQLGPPLAEPPDAPPRRDRPLRLLSPPEEIRVLYAIPEGPPALFIWRRQTLHVTRHAGPERIAPEWWHDRPGTRLRDYFRIEERGGRRLWIYREGLAGDGRGGAPRWFLHGIFA